MEKHPDGGDHFLRYFVMYALGNFLAPTQSRIVDMAMVSAVENVAEIRGMNWCKFVLEQLMKGISSFHTTGYTAVSGCIFVLLIQFLQRVPFLGIPYPKDVPLIQFWDQVKVDEKCKKLKKKTFDVAPVDITPYPLTRGGKLNGVEVDNGRAKASMFSSIPLLSELKTDAEIASCGLSATNEVLETFHRDLGLAFSKLKEGISKIQVSKKPTVNSQQEPEAVGFEDVVAVSPEGQPEVVGSEDAFESQSFWDDPSFQKELKVVYQAVMKTAQNMMPSFDLGIDLS